MALSPAFIATPRIAIASVSTAVTDLTGASGVTTLITGASTGTRVLEIDAQCAASSAAALVNIFLSLDGGTSWTLFDQISITAATTSATVKANRNLATYSNLILPDANARLGCTTTVAQLTKVIALGGDF